LELCPITSPEASKPNGKAEELRMKQDHLSPQDPVYYAPRPLRERSMSPLTPSRETRSEPFSSSASFNNQFEIVGSEGRPHVFEPETDRRKLTGVAARLAAAIGVSALVALFLALAVPNLPLSQKDGSKAALAEFQPFLASVEASRSTASEPSEKLLQQFMEWRQKSTSTTGH
jgi:hypothetical protein